MSAASEPLERACLPPLPPWVSAVGSDEVDRVREPVRTHEVANRRVGSSVPAAAVLPLLEAWIDAHLAEPLTLGRLCEQAGVGARSLQRAFEAKRGVSPMRYVNERRLAAAHARLSNPCPADTVTSIAFDCGFEHMSRFARAYQRRFGERPSSTLARARHRHRAPASAGPLAARRARVSHLG